MATHAILVRHPLGIKHLAYFVRLMAIHTRWKRMSLLFPQLSSDDFAVNKLNFRVAFRARGSNVPSGDGRRCICMGQNRVGRVARDTTWSNDEPFAKQPFAVNALRKILDNVILVNRPLPGNRCSFLVTLAAQERYVQSHDRRPSITGWKNLVIPVTILAARSKRIPPGNRLAVQRFFVETLLFLVARPTLDRLKLLVVGKFLSLQVLMA